MPATGTSHFPISRETKNDVGATRLIGTLGIASGLAAVLASSCCVLPLLLGGLGAGAGVFTTLEFIAPYRVPFLAIGGIAITGAWFAFARKRSVICEPGSSCQVPLRSRTTAAILAVATLLLVTAAVWSTIEPGLLKLARGL